MCGNMGKSYLPYRWATCGSTVDSLLVVIFLQKKKKVNKIVRGNQGENRGVRRGKINRSMELTRLKQYGGVCGEVDWRIVGGCCWEEQKRGRHRVDDPAVDSSARKNQWFQVIGWYPVWWHHQLLGQLWGWVTVRLHSKVGHKKWK